jgi:peptide/nickel transport system substrate-binding protein
LAGKLDPRPEGTLRVAVIGAAPHRDLHQLVSEWATLFGPGLAYSRLLRFEAGPGIEQPSMAVRCDLCDEWRRLDARTYEFDVDPAARWHDTNNFASRPVTAQDVVFSLERLRTRGFPHAGLLDAVDVIQLVNDRTVRLLLRYPDADLPQRLASPYAVIMAPEAVGADLRTGPVVGSGPWLYEQGRSGEVDLAAWPRHHRPSEPAAKAIEALPVNSLSTGAALLGTNQVDVAQVLEPDWPGLEAMGFNSVVVIRQGQGSVLALNAGSGPFVDVGVRRALFQALDPWAALDEVFAGLGAVGVGVPVVEPSWLLGHEALRLGFDQPEAAVAGLRAARAKDIVVTLLIANFGEAHVRLGETLVDQMADAGFVVITEVLTRSQYFSRVWQDREFEAFVGPLPPTATTNDFLLGLVHSDGPQSITGHADSELDVLIEAQSIEADPAARGDLVRQIQARMLDQALLFMPAIAAERWAFSARVRDFAPSMPAGAGDFWRAAAVGGPP